MLKNSDLLILTTHMYGMHGTVPNTQCAIITQRITVVSHSVPITVQFTHAWYIEQGKYRDTQVTGNLMLHANVFRYELKRFLCKIEFCAWKQQATTGIIYYVVVAMKMYVHKLATRTMQI